MRLLLTILAGAILLFGCEKQREQIEKFVFDSKQIVRRQIHTYEFYDDGKIKIDNSVTYHYLAGIPFDTTVSKDAYRYTRTGKIERVVSLTDSSKRVKTYNEMDSLIGDFQIDQHGDTSFLLINEYQDGKLIKIKTRMLRVRLPERAEDVQLADFRNYDTLSFISENIYHGGQLEKSISKDGKGNVTGESQFIHENGKHIKTVRYSFMGSEKYISETTNYLADNHDFISTDAQGDTTAYRRTVFKDDMRIVINYFADIDSQDIWYYDKLNRLIGDINLNLTERIKYVNSYKYDDKGNRIEEMSYEEKLINAR